MISAQRQFYWMVTIKVFAFAPALGVAFFLTSEDSPFAPWAVVVLLSSWLAIAGVGHVKAGRSGAFCKGLFLALAFGAFFTTWPWVVASLSMDPSAVTAANRWAIQLPMGLSFYLLLRQILISREMISRISG
jgi:hypothetical protein